MNAQDAAKRIGTVKEFLPGEYLENKDGVWRLSQLGPFTAKLTKPDTKLFIPISSPLKFARTRNPDGTTRDAPVYLDVTVRDVEKLTENRCLISRAAARRIGMPEEYFCEDLVLEAAAEGGDPLNIELCVPVWRTVGFGGSDPAYPDRTTKVKRLSPGQLVDLALEEFDLHGWSEASDRERFLDGELILAAVPALVDGFEDYGEALFGEAWSDLRRAVARISSTPESELRRTYLGSQRTFRSMLIKIAATLMAEVRRTGG